MSGPYTVAGKRSAYNYFDLELQSAAAKLPSTVAIDATTIVPAKLEGVREFPSSWRIVRFFVFLWTLIKQLFCPKPPKILSELENDLYAHLLLSDCNSKLPRVQTSLLFAHIHDFLSKEKQIPPVLLAEIKQTGDWLAVIERIDKLPLEHAKPPPDPKAKKESASEDSSEAKEKAEKEEKEHLEKIAAHKKELMAQLVTSTTDRIKALREGESCVLPGGTSKHFALYRVSRNNKGYDFQIISCDPSISRGEVLSVAGKEKIRIGTTFSGLKLEEVSDPNWMHALLEVQLPDHAIEVGALVRLFEHFKDRLIDAASPQNLGLHKSHKGGSAIGTLMNFLQDASGTNAGRHRCKLRLQVNALFRYAESVARIPTISETAQEQLQESMKRLNQKMLSMVKKGELTHEEHNWISKEFSSIESMLKGSVEEPSKSANIRLPEPPKGAPEFAKPRAPAAFEHRVAPQATISKLDSRKEATPYQPRQQTYHRSSHLPPLDRQHLMQTLEGTVKDLSTNTDPLALQQKLTDLCIALPFEPGIPKGEKHKMFDDWFPNPNDIWLTFSENERIQISRMLSNIAVTIAQKMKETNTHLPDRWLALFKVASIAVHLATLNSSITQVTMRHYFPFQSVFKNFFEGYQNNRTMYRRRYSEENLAAKQLIDFAYFRGRHRPKNEIDSIGSGDLLFDLYKGTIQSDNEQVKHLVQIAEAIGSVTYPDRSSDIYYGQNKGITALKVNEWGRPIQHQSLSAAVYSLDVAQGTDEDSRKGYVSVGNPWFTQEAIVDDPIRVLKTALKVWYKDYSSDYGTDENVPKHKPIDNLEPWELTQILLTMERNTSIWNLLGLIEKHPSMLHHPDICSMVEILFLDFEMIVERAFKTDPGLREFIVKFFDKQIAALCKNNQIGPALFLIHLSHALRTNLNVPEMGDYSNKVYQWLLQAFQPGSPTTRFRYPLLTEYLTLFEKRTSVQHDELRDLLVFNFYLENAIGDPAYYDPVQKDRIRKMMQLWVPQMQHALTDPQFLQHILDRICQLLGKPLPKGQWAGTFPEYTAGIWQINLMKGTIQQVEEGANLVSLPPEVLRDDTVTQVFPELVKMQPKVAMQVTKQGAIYAFRDMHGCEVRIEQSALQVFCYRKHPERDTWLQPITPHRDLLSQLPRYMSSQQFFIAVDSLEKPEKEIWAYSADGKPQFRYLYAKFNRFGHESMAYYSKEVILKHVDDMRPGGADRREMVPATLSLSLQPDFARLLSFDNAENIVLWSKQGQLKQVEFLRHGLRFNFENNQLKCAEGPFKDYVINLHPTGTQTEGLVAGLFLEHPEKPSILLLPTFSGAFTEQQPAPPVPPQANLLAVIKMLGSNEPIIMKYPNHSWVHGTSSTAGYWVLEYRERLKPTQGQNEGQLWFDVLRYTIAGSQRASCDPLPLAKRALHELSRVAPGAIADPELLKMERLLSEMALHPQGFKINPFGEGVALALQGLLVLITKGSNRIKPHFEGKIADLAMAYFSSGKHIDTQVSLTDAQITTCMHILRKHQPTYFAQNAALLLAKDEPQTIHVASKRSPLFPADTRSPSEILKSRNLVYGLANKQGKKSDLFLSRDRTAIVDAFSELYKTAQAGPKANADFSKMRHTLKSLPTVTKRDDLIIVTDFLSLLFDLRAECADFDLPDIPVPEKFQRKADSKGFSLSKEEEAEKKKIEDENGARFDQFLKTVVQNAEKMHAIFKAKTEKLSAANPEQEMKYKDAAPLIGNVAHEMAEIEDLERMLASMPTKVVPAAIYEPQSNERLFTEKEIAQYFVDAPQQNIDTALELERMAKHAEPVVTVFKEQLQKEMKAFKDAQAAGTTKSRKVKDIAALDQLRKMLTDKVDATQKNMQAEQEAITVMLKTADASIAASEQRAGYRKVVTWDQLSNAFFDDSLPQLLRQAGLTDISADTLKTHLSNYFRAETQRKYALFCRDKIDEMVKDKTAATAFSGEKIVEMLTRCRAYNPVKYPQMLVVEDVLGFLMTSEQLEAVSSFIQNPNGIYRALTGMGKTSVILLLAGLMKANGTNFVTLKFLDSLYPENLAHIQRVLSGVLKRRVTPMLFTMKTPLTFRSHKGDQQIEESIFKRMYRNSLITILERGCSPTDRRSQPLLQAKWISLIYRLCCAPSGTKHNPMDLEHIYWLSKLLLLMIERQDCLFDEHDKSLHPKEEFHLRLGQPEAIPEFMWSTILEIFGVLQVNPKLGLRENIQAELSETQLKAVLEETAKSLAQKWHAKHPKVSAEGLEKYFRGISDEVLDKEVCSECSLTEQDEIALTKDMLLIYLTLTLSKTGNKKYIRSIDGRSVIPCDYADVPREGSEFEEIRERIPYFIQYYIQNGPSFSYFDDWVQRLTREAFEQMEKMGANTPALTPANQLFQSYFPNESLGSLIQNDIARLHAQVKKDPKLIHKFLKVLLPELKNSSRKIPIDAHNQVSMSRASAGTSATNGCVDGLHRQFRVEDDSHRHLRARMLTRFLSRLHTPELLKFDPAKPKKVIKQLVEADKSLRVVIDGAGALWSVPPERAAKQLQKATGLEAVGYFGTNGRLQVEGNATAPLDQRGQVYSHAQARGADVKLSAALPAALTANGRTPLDEVIQNEGRLRQPDQPMRVAVPKDSGISSVGELAQRSLATEAVEYSDNLHRSKKQEQRDIIRSAMIKNVATLFSQKQFDAGIALSQKYLPAGFLVHEGGNNWMKPGEYFRQNRAIEHKNANPITSLEARQKQLKQLGSSLGLDSAAEELAKLQYNRPDLVAKMPSGVYGREGLVTDREIEVELDRDTEAETELSTETETELDTVASTDDDMPYYLGWKPHYDPLFKMHSYKTVLHPAYDSELSFTENYLPLFRNTWAASVHRRVPHDLKQNRLHYVHIKLDGSGKSLNATAVDLHDHEHALYPDFGRLPYQRKYDRYEVAYDTWLKREFDIDPEAPNIALDPTLEPKKIRLIAQMRFEDGQYDDYTDKEFRALEEWIREQKNPADLEHYFVHEVLKSRPRNKERYPFSPLRKLFASIISR